MGFNLGNFLEEAWANINPWDNGATASTVVAKRRKAAPAVTPAPNQRRVQMGQTRQPSLQLGQFSMPKISSISTTNLMSRDEQRKKNLAEIDTIQKKAKADIWDPAKIAGDIGKSVGQVASGAAKGVVDAGTGMINDYGKRVADTGEAAATVIRQLNGENQAFDKHMQDLATNANQTDINVLKRLRTESDPMRRKQLQKVLSLDARGTAINSMQNAQQQQLQATDPRKTLVNAGNTALDVLTLGKGKAILDGVRATQKVTAPVLGQLAKNTTLSGAQGAGIGAAYGGVNTAIDPNASPLDYARNMGQGAAMGAAVGIGAQVALPVAAYGAGRAVNATQKGAQVAAKAVEQSTPKAVASNHPKVVALDQHLGVLRQNYDGTPNQVARQQISKAIQVAQAERNAVYNQELRRLTQGGYQKNPLANEQQAQVATDPLQALKQEALKYKSADEFVKARGEPLYHGTKSDFIQFDNAKMGSQTDSGMYGKGFYLTPNQKSAKHYAGDKGYIKEVYADMKNPYVINTQADIPDIKVPNKTLEDVRNGPENYSRAFTKYLKDRGYDGVIDNLGVADNQRVVFDASQLKTRQQLTDLYNQAHAQSAPVKTKPRVQTQTQTETRKPDTLVDNRTYHNNTTKPPEKLAEYKGKISNEGGDYMSGLKTLEKLAGNDLDKLIKTKGNKKLPRLNNPINKLQDKAADAVTELASGASRKSLTSQNKLGGIAGQIAYGLNRKSSMTKGQKILYERVLGRSGGLGDNLRKTLVKKTEEPFKGLSEDVIKSSRRRVFDVFLEHNDGNTAKAREMLENLTPQEKQYFENVRDINKLRNNLQTGHMDAGTVSKYDDGTHMPRIYDMEAFKKEFNDDVIEEYAKMQGKKLDLNPNKARKQLDDISEELRQTMLDDPAQAAVLRTEIALHNRSILDYTDALTKEKGVVSNVEKKGYLPIPEERRYGAVAGKYVRKDMAFPLLNKGDRFESDLYKWTDAGLTKYQQSKAGAVESYLRQVLTVFNPATRLGNRGANIAQAQMAGFNFPEMAVRQGHYGNVLRNGGDEMTRLAKAYGALDNQEAMLKHSGVVHNAKKGAVKYLQDSYGRTDDAAKVAMFEWQLKKTGNPQEAARFVQRHLPNIGNSGEIYSFFSRLPVLGVPFRAIQPEVYKALASTVGRRTLPFIVAAGLYKTFQDWTWNDVPEDEKKQIQNRFGAGQVPFADVIKKTGADAVLPTSWSFNAGKFADMSKNESQRGKEITEVDPRRLMGMYSINTNTDTENRNPNILDEARKIAPFNIPFVQNEDGGWQARPEEFVGNRLFQPIWQAAIDKDFRGKSIQDPDGKMYDKKDFWGFKNEQRFVDKDTLQPDNRSNTGRLVESTIRNYAPQLGDYIFNPIDSMRGDNKNPLDPSRDKGENIYGQKMQPWQAGARVFGLKGESFDKERLKKMSDTQDYFKRKEQIDKELEGYSPAVKEAYKKWTGQYRIREKKENPFDKDSSIYKKAPIYAFKENKWAEFSQNPELYDIIEKREKIESSTGKPIRAEFDERLDKDFRKLLIYEKSLAPGEDVELQDRLYNDPRWDRYMEIKKEYKNKAAEYYGDSNKDNFDDEMVKNNDPAFPEKPQRLKEYSQAWSDYYDGKGAKPAYTDEYAALKAQHNEAMRQWTNEARKKRGLPEIAQDVWNNKTFGFSNKSGGYGGYSKGGKKKKKFSYSLDEFAPKSSSSKSIYDLLKKAKMKNGIK